MLTLFSGTTRLFQGRSYWRVKLATGKTITEGHASFDFLRGTRNVDWHLDIVGSGDCKHIQELTLCTPEGDLTLPILEPYTAFQFQMGTASLFGGNRIANAQIIGRIDDRETGNCTCVIWDVQGEEQSDGDYKHLWASHSTTVKNFASWRDGIPNIGALSLDVMGVRL